jgi:hypothetical protein
LSAPYSAAICRGAGGGFGVADGITKFTIGRNPSEQYDLLWDEREF